MEEGEEGRKRRALRGNKFQEWNERIEMKKNNEEQPIWWQICWMRTVH